MVLNRRNVGIHGNEHHRGACGKILSRLPLERGIVDKIGHEQAIARLHAAAVHGITLAAELDVLARLFFRQRRHERRDHLRHGQQAHVPAAHYIVTERIVGFLLMTGPSSTEGYFEPDIFSVRRIKVAPAVCFFGFIFMIYGIVRKPKDKTEVVNS